jgi:hypothetical protein
MNLMSRNNTDENAINEIIRLMQTDKSTDAPQDAIRWSKNIFRARAAEPKKSFAQKVLAVLQMDLSPDKAVFGERSASTLQVRQMLFQAGENSLDLRIKKDENGLSLRGQILGEGFENAIVKLFNNENSFEVRTSELSEFEFTKIPTGKYDIHLQKEEREIIVEGLELD